MSTLPQSHVVDLESVNCNNVCGGGGGGCCIFATASEGGGQNLSDANEIVRIVENNGKNEKRESSVSECRVEIVDLHLGKSMRDCRICYLSVDVANQESECIELGCCCKDDLAVAHKQCAEAWFKIKGNKTCEICGSTAKNVGGVNEAESIEQFNEENAAAATATTSSESTNFWQGHRILNFLLACMVFAFVISWLFHFNAES
ncbi:hypothetical protein CDL12_19512 [Handroanthus impetiginosus]|uniref:RING-CH-type domain-containing protein n=1 Tax=Handroanthus impetiginosus TaxID=429701 RepID=A0A2G9GSC9_9LAMI|nr:hypothetical protein CDL12_19512 [Handroanthus impetiginosus]